MKEGLVISSAKVPEKPVCRLPKVNVSKKSRKVINETSWVKQPGFHL